MTCASCGHVNAEGQKFCGECGTPLRPCAVLRRLEPARAEVLRRVRDGAQSPERHAATATRPEPAPAAERRLASVLFADLVGFTTLSESRDAEDVRELLSRYFDMAATVDRALRRDGREVHRRRGDGGLGSAGRA